MFIPDESGVFGNGFDAVGGFFQAAPRRIKTNRLHDFRGRTTTRLRLNNASRSI